MTLAAVMLALGDFFERVAAGADGFDRMFLVRFTAAVGRGRSGFDGSGFAGFRRLFALRGGFILGLLADRLGGLGALGAVAVALVGGVLGRLGRARLLGDQRLPVGDRNLVIVGMDFVEGEEAVAIAAVIDERRLQRRLYARDLG